MGSLPWSTLRHYHYNVFEWHIADFDYWIKVRFQVGETGDVDSVAVPIEPMVEGVVFSRKPPDLTEELIAALAGEYELPMEGLWMSSHSDIVSHAPLSSTTAAC